MHLEAFVTNDSWSLWHYLLFGRTYEQAILLLKVMVVEVLNRVLITYVLSQVHDYLLPAFQINWDAIENILDQMLKVVSWILLHVEIRHRLYWLILHYLSSKLVQSEFAELISHLFYFLSWTILAGNIIGVHFQNICETRKFLSVIVWVRLANYLFYSVVTNTWILYNFNERCCCIIVPKIAIFLMMSKLVDFCDCLTPLVRSLWRIIHLVISFIIWIL